MHIYTSISDAGGNNSINLQNNKNMEILMGFMVLTAIMAVIVTIIVVGEINSQDREELDDILKDPTIKK